MPYHLTPSGEVWNSGLFTVPKAVTEKSLKFASELQLKAILYLLSNGGTAKAEDIAAEFSCTVQSAEECLDFWVYEGIIEKDGVSPVTVKAPEKAEEPVKKTVESLPIPNLTPRDIVNICADNPEIADLLRTAEVILGSSLSNSVKSNLVNMVDYYGLPVSVVVTLLEYYKSERDAGRSITTRKLQLIAKEWAGEEITTIEQASQKLLELTEVEALWLKVLDLCEIEYRQITAPQRKMIARWRIDFDNETVYFACNTMKKYTDSENRSIKAVDNILKDWKRKGFKNADDVKSSPKAEDKTPKNKKGKLKSKPSFDIEEIKTRSALNDNFDI